ncbi:MAG: hypothetical protein AB1758_15340 [Candidatus Eremiobacterota bacterium]
MKGLALVLVALLALTGPARADLPQGRERRLVVLRNALLLWEAEISPEFDHTVYRTHRYRVVADPFLLGRLGNGSRARVSGTFRGDTLTLDPLNALEPAPLQGVSGGSPSWRGRLGARVLSQDPPRLQLDLGDRSQEVTLELTRADERQAWAEWAPRGSFTVEGNVVGATLFDPVFSEATPPGPRTGPQRVIFQMREQFLDRCLARLLETRGQAFRWSVQSEHGSARFAVTRIGATLIGCQPGQLRLHGRVGGDATLQGHKIPLAEGEWYVVVQPRFGPGGLRLSPVPGTLELRLTKPLDLGVPREWTGAMQDMLAANLASAMSIPLPGAYGKELDASGILQSADVARLEVWTAPTGDRRTGLVVVAGPQTGQPGGPDVLENRLEPGSEFALALSPEAVDSALKRNVPGLLPMKRPIPPALRVTESVFIFTLEVTDVEVTELDLRYQRGLFAIDNCVVKVHWTLAGIFQGDEPGARMKGTAKVQSQSGGVLKIRPDIRELEFLSPHILERSPEEQAAIKQKTLQGLSTLELDFLLPSRQPVPDLNSTLELTGVEALEEELRLHGRLQ